LNREGRPWFVIGNEPGPWGNLKLYYFFVGYFFKRSLRASSTIELKALSCLTARIFTSFISSLSSRIIADFLSPDFFLVAIEKIYHKKDSKSRKYLTYHFHYDIILIMISFNNQARIVGNFPGETCQTRAGAGRLESNSLARRST
jgi:hypothetical protein